ncbi:MAG: RNA polymerase sigma factor WhiG [Spirochaetes bacterium]|nr:RNA polymerase sigma factor WhiG [Spirochaetota bacterium]
MFENKTEEELWLEYKNTGNEKIREYFVIKYAPLVKHIAGKISYKIKGAVEFDDLLGFGTIGLLDAIEKYDPSKKIKFNTYATTRIMGSIYDELRNLDWIPRTIRQKTKQLESTISKLEEELGRPPSDEEIANKLNISYEELQKWYTDANGTTLLSLSDLYSKQSGDGEPIEFINTVESPEVKNPERIVEKTEITNLLADAIKELPDKEKKVLILYYYEELTLKEIGEVLDITESRVSQLHTKAIIRLRSKVAKFLNMNVNLEKELDKNKE